MFNRIEIHLTALLRKLTPYFFNSLNVIEFVHFPQCCLYKRILIKSNVSVQILENIFVYKLQSIGQSVFTSQ